MGKALSVRQNLNLQNNTYTYLKYFTVQNADDLKTNGLRIIEGISAASIIKNIYVSYSGTIPSAVNLSVSVIRQQRYTGNEDVIHLTFSGFDIAAASGTEHLRIPFGGADGKRPLYYWFASDNPAKGEGTYDIIVKSDVDLAPSSSNTINFVFDCEIVSGIQQVIEDVNDSVTAPTS